MLAYDFISIIVITSSSSCCVVVRLPVRVAMQTLRLAPPRETTGIPGGE
jgi:hypothetical protein